ncbi:hypothetical protein ACS0TY_013785 [Phlomoides rotata]
MGDFNVVLRAHERSRGAGNHSRPSQEFRTFLDEAHLHDTETTRSQFTWVTHRSTQGYMASCLDRVLVNDDFLDLWFQQMWSTHSSFLPLVATSWALHVTANNPIHRVTLKLKRLKVTLKAWNRSTFRNVFVVMDEAVEALNAVQAEAAALGDTDDLLMTEFDCNIRLNTALAQHQALSTQRNCLQWLHDGDRNTKFFHTMNRVRKTSTGLTSLIIDRVLSFETDSISNVVVEFFSELFPNQDHDSYDDSDLGEFIQPMVDSVENDSLSCIPSVEEINRITQIPKSPRYLLYADDILIFAKVTPSNIRQLHHILSAYGGLSGQLYNPLKSKVYFGSTVSHRVKSAMLRSTGISEGALPFIYLGVPIFCGAPRTYHLTAMADSIIAKFSKWKGHALSLAFRKCMINSIIAASLVHSMMVYYWPRSLLKKIKGAMCNFLWSGDISKKTNSCTVSWSRCFSPINEGGLGIRSLRLANDSFVCKLAWDILCNNSSAFSLIHRRYLTTRGRPKSYSRHTDIIKDILKVHISRYTDSRAWGGSISGLLTSYIAFDLLRASHPRVSWASWIWGSFIPRCQSTLIWRAIWGKLPTANWLSNYGVLGPTICFLCRSASESLYHIMAHCPFSRSFFDKVTRFFDLHLYYDDIGFLDVFLQATVVTFGKQLSCLWRVAFITTLCVIWHAMNRAVFYEVQPSIHRSLAFVIASIKEAGNSVHGHMFGTIRERLILDRLGVRTHPSPLHTTTVIRCRPPSMGRTKVNMKGNTPSSLSTLFVGAVFRSSMCFFVAAFARDVGWGFPLEAKIATILHAILFAFDQGWHSLWVESDSVLAIQTL